MKKFCIFISSILFAVSAGAGIATFSANAPKTARAETDGAATEEITLEGKDFDLLLPGSYEQYLPLSSQVSSIAVAGNYIAVADDDTVYVYDGEKYRAYTHGKGTVSQIELFAGEEGYTLYFQDKFTDLYRYDCDALSETETSPHEAFQQGSAFALSDTGDIYFSRISESIGAIYVNEAAEQNIFDTFSGKTTMYYYDGYLYYTTNGNKLIKNGKDGVRAGEYVGLQTDISDIVVYNNTLFYTAGGALYTYDLNSQTQGKVFDDLKYSALCADGSDLYALGIPTDEAGERTKIRRMDMRSEEFTDYEIGSSSRAENRLASARKSVVNGNKLIIADLNRLTVYDKTSGEFYIIPTEFTPDYIASNGNTILIAKKSVTASEAIIYSFNGQTMARADGFIGGIVGAVCVREADYYLTTSSNVCYKIDGENFEKTQGTARQMQVTAADLASDIYGNLYVEYSDKTVYKYTEEEFFNGSNGESVYKFDTLVSNLAVDFDGNVYGAFDNVIYRSDGKEYTVDVADFLYNAPSSPVSFAFGYESDEVYLVYADHVLYTKSVDLPNVNALAAGATYYNIFEANKEISAVAIQKGALLIDFSLEELREDSETFSSCAYSRSAREMQTIVMDDELTIHGREYYVVAVFDPATRTYSAKLTLKTFCTELNRSDYLSAPAGFTDGAGYLTNDVYLYKYPYLNGIVARERLDKNMKLTVIGELSLNEQTDFEYYYVSYADGDATVYGYVPKSFIRSADVAEPKPDVVRFGAESGAENPNALRYLLIVILAILDVAVAVNYIYIRARERE